MLAGKRASAAADSLRRLGVEPPRRAILLEQRMSGFAGELSGLTVVPQRRIPGFAEPRRGDPGGRLLLGRLGGVPTAVVEGTPHLSGGYLPGECGIAVRTLSALGVRDLVIVSGGESLGAESAAGAIFVVRDWLDLTGAPMLRGAGDPPQGPGIEVPTPGPEVPALAERAGAIAGVTVESGVAALLHGPLLPTPAERRMLRILGAEVLSLGLAPELAAAALCGMRSAALLLLGGTWAERHVRFCVAFLGAFAPCAPADAGDAAATDAGPALDDFRAPA